MPQSIPSRALPVRWKIPIAALLLAVAACHSRDLQNADPPASVEPEGQASRETARGDDPDAAPLEQLRALGYLDAGSGASAGEPADAFARGPELKAPDTGALSELDKLHAQNLGQRANEAYDYLGPRQELAALALAGSERSEAALLDDTEPNRARHAARDEALRRAPDLELHERAKKAGLAGDFRARPRASEIRSEPAPAGAVDAPLSPAQRFLRERASLESLRFQPGSGYWANTYVPGDPVLRWLESQLDARDRNALQHFAARPLVLEAASRQTRQPFDPPGHAALAVFVEADRRGLEREERMLVQVGLRGAERRSGLRPAMSVGIVLDARGPLDAADASSIRALVEAFLEAKDVGDRFSLTVAGRPGATVVGPDEFRHGPLTLALGELFEPSASAGGEALGLVEALTRTADALQRADDPEAPLGSSLVLLVTSQPLGHHSEALAAVAHESAVAGVPVSVVAVGEGCDLDQVERVTLAGQGNRRLLGRPAEAEGVVDRELSALARVIARALRLNIRLAEGVRLVEVVGAERLDAAGAQRVRRAEQSIDRRLARNLGIEKDRGEDEDGIQVVIPSFMSGDSHAVLLDVVASGPGPIAEVTVRYKDLVYLRNSVARTHLSLGRSSQVAGPLQRNVVKNYLAVRLADALKSAGRSLLEGGDAQAVAAVSEFRALLESLRREVPGFQNDTELAADDAMLGEYLALLETDVLESDEPRRYLADSLQLSGYFKTVPRSAAFRTARR